MPQASFAAQVDAFVAQTQQRIDAVFRESAQRIIGVMQTPVGAGGNMPVDTGFLRASLRVTLDAPIPGDQRNPGSVVGYDDSGVALSIAGAPLGSTLFATYGANYAVHQEYGTSKMAGRAFVRLAAAQWQQTVSEVSAELKQRITGA